MSGNEDGDPKPPTGLLVMMLVLVASVVAVGLYVDPPKADCEDNYDVSYNTSIEGIEVGRYNTNVGGLSIITEGVNSTAKIDIILPDSDRYTKEIIPSAGPLTTNFELYDHRDSVMEGWIGAPMGKYTVQLRKNGSVIDRKTVSVQWVEDSCFVVEKA